ncbi:MAG TPA: hypothetical protein PL009_05615 [Flavipsychrobacter sp.]|nr:hypothetical protein [Flavipsychrobacter sp.]
MKDYEKFILCYEAKEFKQCAEIAHQFIDKRTYNGVHFPAEWIANIQDLVSALHPAGFPVTTEQEFLQLCSRIHKMLLEGPNNPTQNN